MTAVKNILPITAVNVRKLIDFTIPQGQGVF